MKKFFQLMIAGVLLILLTSCGPSISVKTDYDVDADFSQFQTYRWMDKHIPGNALDVYPLVQKRVMAAVDKDLQAKGFVLKADDEATDFVVVTHAGTKEKMQVTDWGGYYWYDPWWGPYGGRVDVSYYTEGSLVVDIVDAVEKELVWRGTGKGVVREYSNNEKRQKAIDETMAAILKDFPPIVAEK